MARLGDYIQQIRGVSYKPEDVYDELNENSVPLLRANNIQDDKINLEDIIYVNKKKVKDIQYLKAGDILICTSSGSKELVGKAAFIPQDMPMTFGAFCKVVRPQGCYPQYIGQFFCSPYYRQIISDAAAGANINNIRSEHIDEIQIRICPTDEQIRISNVLKHIDRLMFNRKQQVKKIDQLVKSRFIEMFGDPVIDNGRYTKDRLGNLTTVGSSKRIFEKEYVSKGIPFYRTKEIVELSQGKTISTELFITQERYNEAREKYGVPQKGDLLISAVGTIGAIWIVDGKNSFYYKDGNLLQVSSTEKYKPVYLKYLLEVLINEYKQQMSSGTAYAALTISALKDMLIYEVPIEEQQVFALYIEKSDKLKYAIKQSLEKLEKLKKSLMQQYFV